MGHAHGSMAGLKCPVMTMLRKQGYSLPKPVEQAVAEDPSASKSIMGSMALSVDGPGPVRSQKERRVMTAANHITMSQKRAAVRAKYGKL